MAASTKVYTNIKVIKEMLLAAKPTWSTYLRDDQGQRSCMLDGELLSSILSVHLFPNESVAPNLPGVFVWGFHKGNAGTVSYCTPKWGFSPCGGVIVWRIYRLQQEILDCKSLLPGSAKIQRSLRGLIPGELETRLSGSSWWLCSGTHSGFLRARLLACCHTPVFIGWA